MEEKLIAENLINNNSEAKNYYDDITAIENALEEVKHHAWTVPVVANGKLYLRYLQTLVCYNLMPE